MGEVFLINVNCSKILPVGEKPQYTMFIDSTKMSIVYELIEWIRWIFSVESCFYLTHENSIIHELEDIQLLARLKNFVVNPCGRPNCFHKKLYNTLLKNLNLFVSWNGLEVHKYFLHKINQMDEKLFHENSEASPEKSNSGSEIKKNFEHCKSLQINNSKNPILEANKSLVQKNVSELPDMLPNKKALNNNLESKIEPSQGSVHETNPSFNKRQTSKENFEGFSLHNNSNYFTTDYLNLETSKPNDSASVTYSSAKTTLKRKPETGLNFTQSHSKKFIRPFSLAEILPELQNEFADTKQEESTAAAEFEEKNSVERSESIEIPFLNDTIIGAQKRHRLRKRKKSKKEKELISPNLVNNRSDYNVDYSNTDVYKRNHIRFNIDDEDSLLEIEHFKDEQRREKENEVEIIIEKINNALPFFKSKSEKFLEMTKDSHQHLSNPLEASPKTVMKTEHKIEHSSGVDRQTVPEPNQIHFHGACDSTSATCADDKFGSNSSNPNLSTLLSLKDKFKNGVIIERFH